MNPGTALIGGVLEILQQGEQLLLTLADEDYIRRIPVAFHGSIGGHYRHCLDHFQALVTEGAEGDINYDRRERGTLIEQNRLAALQATRHLAAIFQSWCQMDLSRETGVVCKSSYGAPHSDFALSTLGREVMYAIAHAVHHYALIGIMASLQGLPLQPGFGVAPSTRHYHGIAAGTPLSAAPGLSRHESPDRSPQAALCGESALATAG